MATIKDVAARAGVSVTLVSRYINQKKGVGPDSAKRIQDAIDDLHYKPNALARSLVQGETHTIAVLMDDLCSPRLFPFIQGIEEVAFPAGYTPVFLSGGGNIKRKSSIYAGYSSQGIVDGMILYGDLDVTEGTNKDTFTANLPLVRVDCMTEHLSGDRIRFDSAQGAYQTARHLLRDHGWVCLFTADKDSADTKSRITGYGRAVKEISDEDHMHVVESGWTEEDGYNTMNRLLSKGICPEAIMGTSDANAYGVMKALVEHGKRIPEDVAVSGFGGEGVSSVDTRLPALTTLQLPMKEIGKEAAKMLILRIAQPGVPLENRFFSSQLTLRRSSRL